MGKDFQRSFGVEIECIAPVFTTREQIAAAIVAAGVPCAPIDRMACFHPHIWAVKTDGSLASEWGVEIVSPPLRGEGAFSQIERVCAALARMRCHITPQCGLHVHVDSRSPLGVMDIAAYKRLAMLYIEHETIIDMLMPETRRGARGGNGYCCGFQNVSLANVAACNNVAELAATLRPSLDRPAGRGRRNRPVATVYEHRYVKLNFVSTLRFGTVEFRHHSGTIEATKIINWVCACQRMMDYAAVSTDRQIRAEVSRVVKQVVQSVRRGTKRAIVYDMLLRPEGCTHAEVLAATGWKMVSVMGIAHYYGLSVILSKPNKRYFGFLPGSPHFDRGRPPPQSPTYYEGDVTPLRYGKATKRRLSSAPERAVASNLNEFCKKLQMDEDEAKFWMARAEFFARASMDIAF